MKKRAILLFTAMAVALVMASGVALAKTVTCHSASCTGTDQADTMTNTYTKYSFMNAKGGNDKMYGGDGPDMMVGMTGEDELRGGAGDDDLLGGDMSVNFSDVSSDYVYGGSGDDSITGGYATSGVDYLYGGKGNDHINGNVGAPGQPHTKEVIDCGPGTDTVVFDKGLDVVENCEVEYPY